MQLQSLCELKTDEAVQERVGRLPSKLDDLYNEIYEKITNYTAEADRRVVINTFSWLLCAQRSLKSAEFLAAVSISLIEYFIQVSKDQVLDIYCNLITFDTTLDLFQFVHLSVREFLENRQKYNITTINSFAAETCLFRLISAVNNPVVEKFLSQYGQPLVNESTVSKVFDSVYGRESRPTEKTSSEKQRKRLVNRQPTWMTVLQAGQAKTWTYRKGAKKFLEVGQLSPLWQAVPSGVRTTSSRTSS